MPVLLTYISNTYILFMIYVIHDNCEMEFFRLIQKELLSLLMYCIAVICILLNKQLNPTNYIVHSNYKVYKIT